MTREISEAALEEAIEAALVQGERSGTVAEPLVGYGGEIPGGYHRREPREYDRSLCLLPGDVLDFILITQPAEWKKLQQHHGEDVKRRFLKRLRREIDRRGTLDVLRQGIKDSGCRFRLAYFPPHSGLNAELQKLYESNIFSVVRQLRYSDSGSETLDLVLFLNGLPLFTAELKNPFTGQTVEDAVRQYRRDRDSREPLFAFGRCLAHFAVDPEQVFVATHLTGPPTRFLPFNQGYDRGAGNPPVPPTRGGYRTSYLWEEIWCKRSVLNLIQHFIHRVQKDGEGGEIGGRTKNGGAQIQLFPRYHQLDAVRRLVKDAREHGPGRQYLIEHSAGSGKSFTIAWLAHWLSVLHDDRDERVFDSIVVITDRRVLDRQLQARPSDQCEHLRGRRRWHRDGHRGGRLRQRRQVPAPPQQRGEERAGQTGGGADRAEDLASGGQGGVPCGVPAEPDTGVREAPRRGDLLRPLRAEHGGDDPERDARVCGERLSNTASSPFRALNGLKTPCYGSGPGRSSQARTNVSGSSPSPSAMRLK